MSTLGMLLREMRHRWIGSLLSLAAIAGTAAFIVFLYTTADAAERETRRIQRVSNLRIVPADADPARLLLADDSLEATFDDSLLDELGAQGRVSMNHLIAILRRRVEVEGQKALAVGIARSVATPGRPKAPMHQGVKAGMVELGHGLAAALGREKGDRVELFERDFEVARVLLEKGSEDDWTVFGDLDEFQQAFGLPGRLSEIRAIECVSCESPEDDPLGLLRAELGTIAPQASVLRNAEQADARLRQRTMVERSAEWIVLALLVASMIWTGALAMGNVRERRTEIGVLRALGHGSSRILGLFLGKAVALGLLGGILGALLGTTVALWRGAEIFTLTRAKLVAMPELMLTVSLAAPLFTALAAAIPALLATTQDPAETLQAR